MSWTSEKCSNILQHHRSEALICIVKYFWVWHLPNPHVSSALKAPLRNEGDDDRHSDSSRYFTFISFPTIFTLRHFICTSTKYFICDCRTGPRENLELGFSLMWMLILESLTSLLNLLTPPSLDTMSQSPTWMTIRKGDCSITWSSAASICDPDVPPLLCRW